MPPSTNAPDDIIEKKDTAPVTTACLVIAALTLLGAIIIQLMEIGQYRRDPLKNVDKPNPGVLLSQSEQKAFSQKVADLVAKGPADEAGAGGAEAGKEGTDAGGGDEKDAAAKDKDAEEPAGKAGKPGKAGKADKKGAKKAAAEPEPEPDADAAKDKDADAGKDAAEPAEDTDKADK